ncbi:MAG TPA: IS701 family transposase [Rhizomicrobium sp.]|jgi:SRSO17 transposase
MSREDLDGSSERFSRYVDGLASVIGHADRVNPLRDYCTGLMMPCERKSVEPMAAVTAPARTAAEHQSLLHFVGQASWSDEKVLAKVCESVLPAIERHGAIEAWIIDDTGFPKKGKHSVGVARQYCGQLGKQDNCQAAVSLSIANRHASLPVGYRLYLPQDWAGDAARRRKAGVPADIVFKTKPEIAIDQIHRAVENGLPPGVVLADAGYGNNSLWRSEISALNLPYAVGVRGDTTVWPPGAKLVARKKTRRSRATKVRRGKINPVSVKELALALPTRAWRTIGWREGSNERLSSRFARVRVQAANDDLLRDEEWLLIEWPKGEEQPAKYWLSTLAADITFERMVDLAQMRWRIERDYQELKQELGLGHFEGRGWRGFHHHATLCIAAYGFLVSERETIPPSGPRSTAWRPKLAVSNDYRPRGAAPTNATSHSELDRHDAVAADRGARKAVATMSMLRATESARTLCVMTQ